MRAYLQPGMLSGVIPAIPSKSDAHRLLICAALSKGETRLHLRGTSQDIDATAACLRSLGAEITRQGAITRVNGIGSVTNTPILDCGESGSTLRFLLPVAAALGSGAVLEGRGRLPQRPITGLTDAMNGHGVSFDSEMLPITVSGKLKSGVFEVPGNVSSQYITGLLLALPLCGEECKIRLTSPLVSRAYVDMTLSAMARFGVRVEILEDGYRIPGGQCYQSPGEVQVEGDWSNAAFFLAAGAIGNPVTVTGLSGASSQPDARILEYLTRFGAKVELCGDAYSVTGGELHGCTIDVGESPDLFPILAVTAAFAKGDTTLCNAARLRIKESDRIESTAALLQNLGGYVTIGEDFLTIHGGSLTGGTVSAWGDHRIAMAAAVAASCAGGPVILEGAEACRKSYPGFFEDFSRLSGRVRLEE